MITNASDWQRISLWIARFSVPATCEWTISDRRYMYIGERNSNPRNPALLVVVDNVDKSTGSNNIALAYVQYLDLKKGK